MIRTNGDKRSDTLYYIQSMLGQLRTMAEAERCDMLSYLVEMAYIEASDIVRGERPSRINQQKRNSAA
ncbi:MAG: hypothetical protein H6891_04220 [Brucellaceae bacterium]|nr:hypothetical protein [Brucellaceae bacterium]